MHLLNFEGYRDGAAVTVVAERITHFFDINYSHFPGTKIVLETGCELVVGNSKKQVSMMSTEAINAVPSSTPVR